VAAPDTGANPGPGTGRSYYATPYDLGFRQWSLDITPDDAGNPAFPGQILNPYLNIASPLRWTTNDWDPALRFWSLPTFDPNVTEWLKSVDTSAPSILAAREFAGQSTVWNQAQAGLLTLNWLEPNDVLWNVVGPAGWNKIRAEIEQLVVLQEDDRANYLAEIDGQADALADYMLAFVGANRARYPWTVELVSCGLAIGNIAYMRWKSVFRRVRPSVLCPGLTPPFGPPGHPAFPSGHSTLGHLIALFLLEIPELAQRHGVFTAVGGPGAQVQLPLPPGGGGAPANALTGTNALPSPLLWLGDRLAKNRERLGVHYASDSSGGRHLAAGLWRAIVHDKTIDCPTLHSVLNHAKAEWL
jgi:hypothetical protein